MSTVLVLLLMGYSIYNPSILSIRDLFWEEFINIDRFLRTYQLKEFVFPSMWQFNRLSAKNYNYMVISTNIECNLERLAQGRSYNNDNIQVDNCLFSRFAIFVGDGGVMNVDGGDYSLNVTNSIFYNCSCSNFGGSIYFVSTSSCLINCCANRCHAYKNHFAYIHASSGFYEQISISSCSYLSTGYYPIRLITGGQIIIRTNSSSNKAEWTSAILIENPSSFFSSYCTFFFNKASDCICINFNLICGKMSSANIIQNDSPNRYAVVSQYVGSITMEYCVFNLNQNYLFQINPGSLTLSHCFISHIGSFSSLTPVVTSNNNSKISTASYEISYFGSHYCFGQDLVSMHTLMSPTPPKILFLFYLFVV